MKREYPLLSSILLYVFFTVYVFLLLYLLFLERIYFGGDRYILRSVNIIPFKTIRVFLEGGISTYSSFVLTNILGNLLMFAPLGLYIPVLTGGKTVGFYMRWFLLFNLSVELLQWILGAGAADIDDIILNSIGFLGGLLAYKFMLAVLGQKERVRFVTAILSAVVGIPVVCIAAYLFVH